MFRHEMATKTLLGRRVTRYVANGQLVPDALVVEVMASRLPKRTGFVLDGFPRTRAQAEGLDEVLARRRLPVDGAVYISSPESVLVRRLSGRLVCAQCGANYHIRTMRPKQPGRCDQCQGRLITRKDDQLKTIRKRLAIHRREMTPLLQYYRRRGLLNSVDGRGRIGTVFLRAMGLFRRHGWVR